MKNLGTIQTFSGSVKNKAHNGDIMLLLQQQLLRVVDMSAAKKKKTSHNDLEKAAIFWAEVTLELWNIPRRPATKSEF